MKKTGSKANWLRKIGVSKNQGALIYTPNSITRVLKTLTTKVTETAKSAHLRCISGSLAAVQAEEETKQRRRHMASSIHWGVLFAGVLLIGALLLDTPTWHEANFLQPLATSRSEGLEEQRLAAGFANASCSRIHVHLGAGSHFATKSKNELSPNLVSFHSLPWDSTITCGTTRSDQGTGQLKESGSTVSGKRLCYSSRAGGPGMSVRIGSSSNTCA